VRPCAAANTGNPLLDNLEKFASILCMIVGTIFLITGQMM